MREAAGTRDKKLGGSALRRALKVARVQPLHSHRHFVTKMKVGKKTHRQRADWRPAAVGDMASGQEGVPRAEPDDGVRPEERACGRSQATKRHRAVGRERRAKPTPAANTVRLHEKKKPAGRGKPRGAPAREERNGGLEKRAPEKQHEIADAMGTIFGKINRKREMTTGLQ